MKAAALFSGGKDSTYAIYKALTQGYEVEYLIHNHFDFPRPSPHTVNIHLVEMIADSIGIRLVKRRLDKGKEKEQLSALIKGLSVNVLVAGDLYIEGHLKWLLEVCRDAGVRLYEPLWLNDSKRSEQVLIEELRYGFKPFICGVDTRRLEARFLGRKMDFELAQEIVGLARQRGFDPCGENGEYHTLVLDGPMFKKPITVTGYKVIESGSYAYLVVDVE